MSRKLSLTQILSNLDPRLTTSGRDVANEYRSVFEHRVTASAQPPSMLVEHYSVQAEYNHTKRNATYKTRILWHPIARYIASNVPESQAKHRSRDIALAVGPLRLNEMARRINFVREHKTEYAKYAITKGQSESLFSMLIDKTLHHMQLNHEWWKQYVKEHADRSMGVGPGVRWNAAYSLTPSEVAQIYDGVRDAVETIGRSMGFNTTVPFNMGIRARCNELTSWASKSEGELTRSREVRFRPSHSFWTAFIPNKAGWYHDVLGEAASILNVGLDYHVPFVEGGKIYPIASEEFHDGYRFQAYDGKSWETGVCLLLGDAFRPFMTIIDGFATLPSGISCTSMLNTIAMLALTRNAQGDAVILGDDFNVWRGKGIPRLAALEFQPEDTSQKYILGVSYAQDYDLPRICGRRLTTDSAGGHVPVPLNNTWVAVSKQRSAQSRALYTSMWFGYYGDRTLLDAIRRLRPADVMSPRQMIEDLAEQHVEVDPFAWAEEQGIKNIVVK